MVRLFDKLTTHHERNHFIVLWLYLLALASAPKTNSLPYTFTSSPKTAPPAAKIRQKSQSGISCAIHNGVQYDENFMSSFMLDNVPILADVLIKLCLGLETSQHPSISKFQEIPIVVIKLERNMKKSIPIVALSFLSATLTGIFYTADVQGKQKKAY